MTLDRNTAKRLRALLLSSLVITFLGSWGTVVYVAYHAPADYQPVLQWSTRLMLTIVFVCVSLGMYFRKPLRFHESRRQIQECRKEAYRHSPDSHLLRLND
jgi:hypothetical protein